MSESNGAVDVLDYIPDDGYTESGYIRAVPRIHGAVTFTFRPMRTQEQSRLNAMLVGKEAGEQDLLIASALAARVKSWSIKKRNSGKVVNDPFVAAEITRDFILLLKPILFTKLTGIVCWGTIPSELLEDASTPKKDEWVDIQQEAAILGVDPVKLKQERDEKNSLKAPV